jgi:predicted Zn-dependent peptidase
MIARSLLLAISVATLLGSCGGGSKTAPTAPAPAPTPDDNRRMPPPDTANLPTAEKAKAIETPKLYPQPVAGDTAKVTIHRLSNGMTVYLSPDVQTPSVVAHIAVRAGSRNDPRLSTGLAHYLEHMLFKGTSQLGTLDYAKEKPHLDKIASLYADLRKPGAARDKILKEIDQETQATAELAVPNELDQMYARIGITGLNAFTGSDMTVYVTEVPKNRLVQWATVEASRYADPVFRLFWPELEAVYEEKNRSLDSPPRRVNEAFMRALFPQHGYGWSSTLGEVEHLKYPAYGDMVAFFNRYYTPQNMAILLAGDVDESILPVLEKAFGGFKRPAGNAMDEGVLTPQKGRSVVTVKVPSNEGVKLGWPLVSATHPDRLALQVMDLLLLDGRQGILSRELLLTQKVANAASNPTFMREGGYFDLWADALDGQKPEELEAMLWGLVGKLQRGEFTDTDLATAILTFEMNTQLQLESNDGRMGLMEEAFINGEDWNDTVSRVDRMRKITRADVMRVAKQYLTKDVVVLQKVKGTEAPPKITKPGITPVKLDPTRRSAFAKSILDMPVAPIEPVAIKAGTDYQRTKLATGPLISVKNTRNGLFSIRYEFDLGRIDDKLVCLAIDTMKVSGAGTQTAEQVQRKLHELGLTIDTSCGRDESAIMISGIDRNADAGMALLREWVASPSFDDAILKATVTAALTARANAMANPQAIVGASGSFARWGDKSDMLVVPSNKDIQAATPAQLKKSLTAFLHLKHRSAYFGPRDSKDLAALVTFGDGKVTPKPRMVAKFRPPNTGIVTDQETAQTHVWLIWPRKPANDTERAAGAVFSEYISPILYQEVREARGLAYTVYGGYGTGSRKVDDASLFAYVGTQGDKTQDALDAVMSTLKRPVDDNRLALAKETIAQNHRTERLAPRAIPFVVYAWEDEGVTSDPRAARAKRMAAVTKPALEAWMKGALGGKIILSVVGDRKKLDEAKLTKIVPLTFVPIAKLFGY